MIFTSTSHWQKQYHLYILFILILFSFLSLSTILKQGLAYGVDNTPHYVFTVRFAQMIKEGNFRLWDPDPSLGFPMLYYYQPIPYTFTTLLYLLLPFMDSLFIYKFIIVTLFSLFPLAVYLGMRFMSIDKKTCLVSAFFSLTIENHYSFGFEISSYFIWGLYSMLFGLYH